MKLFVFIFYGGVTYEISDIFNETSSNNIKININGKLVKLYKKEKILMKNVLYVKKCYVVQKI